MEWLVKAAGSELPKDVVVHNMRASTADQILTDCGLSTPARAEEPAP